MSISILRHWDLLIGSRFDISMLTTISRAGGARDVLASVGSTPLWQAKLIRIAKQPNPSPMSPLWHQRNHPSDDLGSFEKATTESPELEGLPHSRQCKCMVGNLDGWESKSKLLSHRQRTSPPFFWWSLGLRILSPSRTWWRWHIQLGSKGLLLASTLLTLSEKIRVDCNILAEDSPQPPRVLTPASCLFFLEAPKRL